MIRVEAIEWGDGVKAYKYKVVYLFGIPIYTYVHKQEIQWGSLQ